MPGSPERILLGRMPERDPGDARRQTRARWGLDKPLFPDQFVAYVTSTLQGDLGFSFAARGRPVSEVLAQRLWPTIILFGLGRAHRDRRRASRSARTRAGNAAALVDYVGNGVSLVLYSMPYFLLGMVLLLVFATALGWFPTYGMLTAGRRRTTRPLELLADFGSHLVAAAGDGRARASIGQYAILMRSSVVETLSEDYVTTARAMGLRDVARPPHHALPNAMLPTVTLIAINLGYVVAGAITVEVVFNWPGPRDADGRGARRPRLPGPPGRLPAAVACRSSSRTSAPTCSTACSIRGCGRDGAGRPARRRAAPVAPSAPASGGHARRCCARSLRRPDGLAGRR